MALKLDALFYRMYTRMLSEDSHAADTDDHGDGHGDGHSEFGVHVLPMDVYKSILFFTAIYVAGTVSSRFLKMPNLVGEIFAGIILGPPLLDFVPNAEAFVMLGEVGLVLLVLEAGIDIDMTMLKLIGARGVSIAIIGSILPIVFGVGIAFAFGMDTKGAIAAGSAFGPTSLGIAMNILRSGKIINTPVGQLIVAAAIIDDMIALIILSQLPALTGPSSVMAIIIPVISALGFLIIGGAIALFVAPPFLNKYVISRFSEHSKGKVEMTIMISVLILLIPATIYAKASHLMGAFIAGLLFCRSPDLHHVFVHQFKLLMKWLMRIFFAATIGFQVPIKDFADGGIILRGLGFTLALIGKLLVGLMVPNFTQSRRFTNFHLRDCLVTGFSMAAEGEFAFVIAVFGVDNGLFSKDMYASIVLAILISTIIPPFLLRYTISRYNKKSEDVVKAAAEEELARLANIDKDSVLMGEITSDAAVFLCIQTQSDPSWGLVHKIMSGLQRMEVDIIDHRSWHPRGVNTTLVNEIYAKTVVQKNPDEETDAVTAKFEKIQDMLTKVINQPEIAKVKATRWYPGVVTEITEEIIEDGESQTSKLRKRNVTSMITTEAGKALEKDMDRQTHATKARPIEEILNSVLLPDVTTPESTTTTTTTGGKPRKRNRRQKMMSSPTIGGDMFGEMSQQKKASGAPKNNLNKTAGGGNVWSDARSFEATTGQLAELVVGREVFNIRVAPSALARVRKGVDSSVVLNSGDISVTSQDDDTPQNFEHKLTGFVRAPMLVKITEESVHETEVEE